MPDNEFRAKFMISVSGWTCGKFPVKLLSLSSIPRKAVPSKSGIGPESWFPESTSDGICSTPVGNPPLKSLLKRNSHRSDVIPEKSGSSPLNWLPPRLRNSNDVDFVIHAGILPLKFPQLRLSQDKCV